MTAGSTCEICRHSYWEFHVEARRLLAKPPEAKRGRCDDCVVCLDPSVPQRTERPVKAPEPARA